MNAYLSTHPQPRALLQAAKESPQDDTPRLVLADWFEDQCDPDRAEFIRLQCHLAAECKAAGTFEAERRCRDLLERHGGAWLGSLWQHTLAPLQWHRGLLSVRLPASIQPERIGDVLPWIDTVIVVIQGRAGLQRMAELLDGMTLNHLYIDLRRPLKDEAFIKVLGLIKESICLRSLSIAWPLLLQCRQTGPEGKRVAPAASQQLLATLIKECPLGRHLTHLGSSPPFCDAQVSCLLDLGVRPADALDRLWMHRIAPTCFTLRKHING
jgi:uncharacterized protein (TIGR02996 family)